MSTPRKKNTNDLYGQHGQTKKVSDLQKRIIEAYENMEPAEFQVVHNLQTGAVHRYKNTKSTTPKGQKYTYVKKVKYQIDGQFFVSALDVVDAGLADDIKTVYKRIAAKKPEWKGWCKVLRAAT